MRGIFDPEALRVASQGGHYDIEGRRSAIAERQPKSRWRRQMHHDPGTAELRVR
jgi:hypothetical protein